MISYALLITIGIIGHLRTFIIHIIGEWLFLIGIWIMIIHSTWWALKKSKIYEDYSKSNLYTKLKRMYKSRSSSTSTVSTISSSSNNKGEHHKSHSFSQRRIKRKRGGSVVTISSSYYNLIKILQDNDAFKLFMNHLNKEFSIENGLAIIEFTQFQELVKQKYDKNDILMSRSRSRSRLPSMKKSASSAKLAQFVSGTMARFTDNNSTKRLKSIERNLQLDIESDHTVNKKQHNSDGMIIIDEAVSSPDIDDDIEIIFNETKDDDPNADNKDNNHDNNNKEKYGEYEVFLDLPSSLPKSLIIWNDEKEDLELKVIKLCQKYIYHNADHELNLSSKQRKTIMDQVTNINVITSYQIHHIFDAPIKSLLHLLNDSLTRFTDTDNYRKIEHKLSNQTLKTEKIQRALSL